MARRAFGMTHGEEGRINEGPPLASPLARLQRGAQGHQGFRHQFHKPTVTDQLRKSPPQMRGHGAQQIVLECPIARLVEGDHDGPHFAHTQATLPPPLPVPAGEYPLLPRRDKLLTEVVNVTKERYDLPTGASSVGRCWSRSPPY